MKSPLEILDHIFSEEAKSKHRQTLFSTILYVNMVPPSNISFIFSGATEFSLWFFSLACEGASMKLNEYFGKAARRTVFIFQCNIKHLDIG